MLSAKYNKAMKIHTMAKELGRLGGKVRAKRLSSKRKKEIASLGGKARSQSFVATKRIKENFNYLATMYLLKPKLSRVKRLQSFRGPLPGIYPTSQ